MEVSWHLFKNMLLLISMPAVCLAAVIQLATENTCMYVKDSIWDILDGRECLHHREQGLMPTHSDSEWDRWSSPAELLLGNHYNISMPSERRATWFPFLWQSQRTAGAIQMQFIGEVIYQGNPAGGVLPHVISEDYEVPPFGAWQSEKGRAHTCTCIILLCNICTLKWSKLPCFLTPGCLRRQPPHISIWSEVHWHTDSATC